MTSTELRVALRELGITPYRFAVEARVEPSTVYKWLKPGASVPGYAQTIVELLTERKRLTDLAHVDITVGYNPFSQEIP